MQIYRRNLGALLNKVLMEGVEETLPPRVINFCMMKVLPGLGVDPIQH
jgi:hypothetical protein